MAELIPSDEIPVIDQDMTDWEFNQDPFPQLDEWRKLGPVVYNAWNDGYMTFGYRDSAKVLGNLKEFDSSIAAANFVRGFGGVTMEAIDSPRHHEMRGVWAPDFQRDSLEAQRELITRVVDSRLLPFVEKVRSGEKVDAIVELTRGIPTLVIAEMMGIEADRYEDFSDWSDGIGGFSAARGIENTEHGRELLEEGVRSQQALNAYLGEIVEKRRSLGKAAAGDDLTSTMVFHPFAIEDMEESEIVASLTQLVFAGNETTAKLMASLMVALAQYPDQRRAVVADRSLIPQTIEEVLRWMTVVADIPARNAISETSNVRGFHIPLGAAMHPLVMAANRDPERWEDPNTFDIFREQKQHLGFGFGMHVCLGLNLARLETEIWLDRLLDELPEFDLAGPVDYGRNWVLRGPMEVPITVA